MKKAIFKKVINIKKIGKEVCYDIEVPKYANFVLGNGIITHNSVDLDSRYHINYILATQQITKIPEEVITQCRYIMIPYNADLQTMKDCFRLAGMMRNIQVFNNEMVRLKRKLSKFNWIIIDRNTNKYNIIQPLAPLSFHAETSN